jgi:adenosine deaminase
VPYETVHRGLRRALADGAERLGISSAMILCFLRHLSEEDAFTTLEAARPFVAELAGVGLDSGERGNPPSKFERVFAAARELGLRPVAHAGEEGPAAYIREALDLLKVVRVDHGVRCDEDPALVAELAARRIPLTVCPLSNTKLRVYQTMNEHNLARLLAQGVCVTVNSDDPAYFGGYIADNYRAIAAALPLGAPELVQLAKNAVEAAWLPDARKAALTAEIDRVAVEAAS